MGFRTRATGWAVWLFLGSSAIGIADDGVISGRVTAAEDGTPVASATVYFSQDLVFRSVRTDENGEYSRAAPAGSYLAIARAAGFLPRCFDDRPEEVCDEAAGDRVTVASGEETRNIDFALDREAVLRGRITDVQTGEGLEESRVIVYRKTGASFESVGDAWADSEGAFRKNRLDPGTYVLIAIAAGYRVEAWEDLPCRVPGSVNPEEACPLTEAREVTVGFGDVVEELDFALDPLGRISGRITDAQTGRGLSGAVIYLQDALGGPAARVLPDVDGYYESHGLESGSWLVHAATRQHVGELFPGIPCTDFLGEIECPRDEAVPVTVMVGEETAGVDLALDLGGSLRGTVVDKADGRPLGGILVTATREGIPFRAWSDAEGRYELAGSREGLYRVETFALGFLSQVYDGLDCSPECPEGDPVAIELGETKPGIDFSLNRPEGCITSSENLCLSNGRFAVEAFYGSGAERAGAVPLTDDSGYFWFFDASNVEILAKVLDGCDLNGRFWIFAAGLTDVEVRLRVTDTETGEVQEYRNDQGNAFAPIQDTAAFDGCF